MTKAQFLQDSYLRQAPARVVDMTSEGGIILDQSIFYATSGGQPGDSGVLQWDGEETQIATTIRRI